MAPRSDVVLIDSLILRGHECLERIKRNATEQVEVERRSCEGAKNAASYLEVVEGLEKSISIVVNYLERCDLKLSSLKIANRGEPLPEPTIDQSKNRSKRSDHRHKNVNVSMGDQQPNKCNHTKSIYESVLEERKNRKIRRNRMIV
jgi:hypothetical protein